MAITRQKEGEEAHVHRPAVHLDGKEIAPPPPAGTSFEPNHRLWSMKELAATRAKREGRAVEAETEVGTASTSPPRTVTVCGISTRRGTPLTEPLHQPRPRGGPPSGTTSLRGSESSAPARLGPTNHGFSDVWLAKSRRTRTPSFHPPAMSRVAAMLAVGSPLTKSRSARSPTAMRPRSRKPNSRAGLNVAAANASDAVRPDWTRRCSSR